MTLLTTIGNIFKRHQMLSNTISGALLFLAGDAIEQKLEVRSKIIPEFDKDRLMRIGVVGLSEGPTHVIFYNFLDKLIPGKTVKDVGKKILLDQMIACPMFCFQFLMGMSLLEGKSLNSSWTEFKSKFPTVYCVDWLVWPPCQFINFYFVSRKYRVFYINVVTVMWNVFLSYMKHYDQNTTTQMIKK